MIQEAGFLRKSEFLDDWYVVDGAPFGQPEGTAAEWQELIYLVETGKHNGFPGRRLGFALTVDGGFDLFSPRNAINADDMARVLPHKVTNWIVNAKGVLSATGDYQHTDSAD